MAVSTPVTVFDAALADLVEWVPDLMWPMSVHTFAKMRTDPQLAAILAAYTLPIRRAPWSIDPTGCRPEVAQFVSDNLGLPVAGSDKGTAFRSPVRWADFLRLATLQLVYGHMPFEKVYDTSSGMARLASVTERMPHTIIDIDIDARTNALIRARQLAPVGGDPIVLDRERLVWFAHDREGAAWQGRSLLRHAFGPWLIKHEMWRVNATSLRRTGMGIPEVIAPLGATATQISEAQQLASSVRVADQGGVGLPNGFTLRLRGIEGTVPDPMGFITYLDQQMTRGALAGVVDMPGSAHGSRAAAATFVDLLMLSLQSIADHMAETMTTDLAADLVEKNWGLDEPIPAVTVGDVGGRQEVTAVALQALLASGALSADPALESYVRELFSLPQRDPNAPPPTPPAPAPAPASATDMPMARRTPRIRAAGAPTTVLRRNLTAVEAAAKTDFVQVQDDWQTALDALVTAWAAKITPLVRAQLLEQVTAAVDSGDIAALSALTVDVPGAQDLIDQHMADLADQAAQQMTDEAAAQGVTIAGTPAIDVARLTAVAGLIASLVNSGLASSAARKALQVWGPESTSKEVTDAVKLHLVSLTDASLRDNLGAALSVAQNEGRVAVLRDAPDTATYYASEVLDTNTCGPCADNDGHEYTSLDDADAAYASGGFIDCDGGLRCRGIVITVFDQAAGDQADALDQAA